MASHSSAPGTRHAARRAAAAAGHPPAIGAVGWARVGLRTLMIVAVLIPSVALHYLWRAFAPTSPWPRRFLGTTARIAGARVASSGQPLPRDVMFLANHVSWIDILAIAGASGSAFVAKAEIRAAPVVGWLSTLNRTLFVAREDRMGVAQQIDQLRQAIAAIPAVTVFPEGTTTDGRSLLPFKASLLKVLDPAPSGLMVQPLVLDYGAVGPEIGWIGSERGKDNALRILARPGSFRLDIIFLEPFSPVTVAGRKAIAAEARGRIAAALGERLGHATPDFIGHDAWAAGESGWGAASAAL